MKKIKVSAVECLKIPKAISKICDLLSPLDLEKSLVEPILQQDLEVQNEQAEEANTLLQSQLAAEKLKTAQLENQLSAGNGIDSYSKEVVPFILQ